MNMDEYFRRDPISDRGISVVVPAYNDANCLEAAVASVMDAMNRLERGHEIIVVDDGSTDSTGEIARQLGTATKRIRLIQHNYHQGHGAALRSAFHTAKYPLVLQLAPSDYRFMSEIERLLDAIDKVDIVCGYREVRPRSLVERVADWFRARVVRSVFAVHVRDADCGIRLFRRAVLRRIPIQSNGRFADTEILAKANFMNVLVDEVPVSDRPPGSRVGRGMREPFGQTLREACRVFWRPQFTTDAGNSNRSGATGAEAA
jgi:glycosyltransferase involved in cell wall biosynthesis